MSNNYLDAIGLIKSAILKSRYRAAALANKELLSLYYGIGGYISANSRKGTWGTNALFVISSQLQKELPGLRGFSSPNLKKMRIFYEEWQEDFIIQSNRSLLMNDFRQMTSDDLQSIETMHVLDRSLLMNDLELQNFTISDNFPLQHFLKVGFTHHCEIIYNVKSREERLFYIQKCATEFWSVETLQYHLKSNLYKNQGKLPNNFQTTISDKDLQRKALFSFKDEYLLDYINSG